LTSAILTQTIWILAERGSLVNYLINHNFEENECNCDFPFKVSINYTKDILVYFWIFAMFLGPFSNFRLWCIFCSYKTYLQIQNLQSILLKYI